MSESVGWKALLAGSGEPGSNQFPLPAYSEFMPAPRLGRKPYGEPDVDLFAEDDPFGWRISEAEQAWELAPGLERIAREVYASLLPLGQGREEHLIRGHGGRNLAGNPYWPPELAERAGRLPHERFVSLLALALARTQDDKGRVRWTLFGSSEHGPERAFWRSFAAASGVGQGAASMGGSTQPRRRRPVRRRALPAHLPAVRLAPRGCAPPLPRGRPPPAAVPGQPGVLGNADVPGPRRGTAGGDATAAAPPDPPPPGSRDPHPTVRLAARAGAGQARA